MDATNKGVGEWEGSEEGGLYGVQIWSILVLVTPTLRV